MNRSDLGSHGWTSGPREISRVRILHLEDSAADAALIMDMLDDRDLPCAITHALQRSDFENAIEREHFDIILVDNHLPGYSGFAALEFAKKHQPQVPVIILSGTLDDEQAVQCLKQGATDYVLKERLARLIPAIRRALDEADERIIKNAAEQRIREQADLLNLTQDAIIVRNMNDRVIYWNSGSERLFGWTADQALGQDFASLLQGDIEDLKDAKEKLLQDGDWLGEIILKNRAGQEIKLISRWNLVRDKEGQPLKILSTNTDVREMKKTDAAPARSSRPAPVTAGR